MVLAELYLGTLSSEADTKNLALRKEYRHERKLHFSNIETLEKNKDYSKNGSCYFYSVYIHKVNPVPRNCIIA